MEIRSLLEEEVEDLEPRYAFLNAAGTHTITERPTRFLRLTLSSESIVGIIAIYDGVQDPANLVASTFLSASTARNKSSRLFDIQLSRGLTIVVQDTPDFTISYL